jgi:uncharacterized membrane protein
MKELHDEDRIFKQETAELVVISATGEGVVDWTGFVVSFKGVFLEGLEVAFIVLTFGTSSGRVDLSAAGAIAAFLLVSLVGVALHRPLSRVPENTVKFAVGVILAAFAPTGWRRRRRRLGAARSGQPVARGAVWHRWRCCLTLKRGVGVAEQTPVGSAH